MNNHTLLYKNHGKAIGSWEIWTDGATVHSRAFKKLGGNPTTNEYAAEGKNIGRANETSPADQAALEAASKARLKLDKGYVATIEEAKAPVTNTLGLPLPMLATPLEKVKPEKIDWKTAYIQPKLDGHRALYKDGVLYSRQGKVLEHMGHVVTAIKDSGLGHLHLDGELYVHGRPLQEISRLIKKYTQESLTVEYHIYDQVSDERFFHRISGLGEAWGTEIDNVLQAVNTVIVTNMDEMMLFHEKYRAQGYEGTMLRFSHDPYSTGKRSRTLLKVKEFHDAEFTVVDVVEGKPYIKDAMTYQVPVWICEISNHGATFNVTAAGTMEEKHQQWLDRHEHVHSQLTVKYHYLSKDGIPQLPVALRWREDV